MSQLEEPKLVLIDVKEGHLYHLKQSSEKLIGEIPRLEEPTKRQKKWAKRKMKAPQRTWERWYVGQYFTQEQKLEMGLSDEEIMRNE